MNHVRFRYLFALKALILVCGVLTVSASHAEFFGAPTGRTAKLSTQMPLAVEVAYSNGEFAGVDYQQLGLRMNYQYAPDILVFGDLGQSELNSESDFSFGLGGYYALGLSILGSDDSAVKVSYHQANFDRNARISPGSTSIDYVCEEDDPITLLGILDDDLLPNVNICLPEVSTSSGSTVTSGGVIRNIALELLISGAMSNSVLGDKAHWYANGGIQMLNGDDDSDTVLGIGAGVVLPLAESEIYAGFDYADETYMGVGFRYFVQ